MLRGLDEPARGHFETLLGEAPKYVPALANLGLIYRRQHRLTLARMALNLALQVEPNNSAVWTTLSGSYVN